MMQRFTDQEDHNRDDLDIPNARPRAPTPSALPPTFQYSPSIASPSSQYISSPMSTASPAPPVPPLQAHAHAISPSSTRARSQSVSAGPASAASQSTVNPTTAPLSVPEEYAADAHPLPPATPPHAFARPVKYTHTSYPDPSGFPTPPSYPPVPGLMACGSSSTSTRSSAYTSPGASAPLSSNDLSTLGIGLGKFASREDDYDSPYAEDGAIDVGAAITADTHMPILPRSTSYQQSLVRESSESSISRLQFAANAAAAANGNGFSLGWSDSYAPSTLSGSSSYEGSPAPGSDQRVPRKIASTKWRTVDEDDDPDPADDSDAQPPPPSNFHSRPRKGTEGSSRSESMSGLTSESMSGLTSASEDDTDVEEYGVAKEGDEEDLDEVRTAAIVVAEEGRGQIVRGEGLNVTAVNIQPGTTHLLLASLATPNSLPGLLTQTLPNIANTLLALDISANYLVALPPALATCMQLTELNIANNPLRALPVWLAGLEGLRVLIADATGITTLPPELASLRALNVLSIRRNKLMALPAWLSRLPALERLEIEGNPFQGPWQALLAPLIATRPMVSAGISVPGETLRPQPQQASSKSNQNSVYGPGLSFYGESSLSPHDTAAAVNGFTRSTQHLLTPHSGAQGSFFAATDSDSYSMPNSAVEADDSVARRFIPEEEELTEEFTIVPRAVSSSSQRALHSSSQLAVPPSPLTSSSSQRSITSLNSPTQLPYLYSPSGRSNGYDRFEQALAEVQEDIPSPGPSPIQRAPTFSVVDRPTPSPYLRPLSRTRTTPSRSRLSSGSGSGSIATFIADQGHGDGGSRSRRSSSTSQRPRTSSSAASQRPRTSSATSQRPHTDYVPTRYGGPLDVEDSGFYGSRMDYLSYGSKSDGREFLDGVFDNAAGVGTLASTEKEDERRKELRRMRSADELRRALESVIGPSPPMTLTQEEDDIPGDAGNNQAPPFSVSTLDPRPPLRHSHTEDVDATVTGSNSAVVRGVTLTDRPGAKRFASLGRSQEFGVGSTTRARSALTDGMWDADGDADVEGDGEERRTRPASRPMSPTERDKGATDDPNRPVKAKGKWGFLKKMSMGRMRPEPVSRPSSTRTSPPGVGVRQVGTSSDHANETSPTAKPRKAPREGLAFPPGPKMPPPPPLPKASIPSQPSYPSLAVPSSRLRAAKRRSFLSLDGPPALNIPIPSTAPFLLESIIATSDTDELEFTSTVESKVESLLSPPAQPQELQQQSDARALRSVMAYLSDLADLGMPNSAPGGPMGNANPSTFNLGSSSSQENEEGRSRRPTLVESGRVLSEGSLASNASSGSGIGGAARSDDPRATTISMITTDSGGSGRDEERSKHKDDKSKRALIIKEIVETERTYVKGLQELIDIYVKPASLPVNTLGNAVASTKETVIPQQERKIVFNGLDSLFSFHTQSFLPALENAAMPLLRASSAETDIAGEISMTAATSIANVFVSHAAFMRMYSTYINNFDNAVQRLKQWTLDPRTTQSTPGSSMTSPNSSTAHLAGMSLQMSAVNVSSVGDNASASGIHPLTTSQRKRIKSYLKRCRLNPKHSQLNLEGYLLLPIQRIPRYRMLELVRFTPPNPEAYDDPMDRALTEISSLANNMNEGKREAESRRKLVQWQTRIRGKFPSPLVQPHRRLIMDGPLYLTRVVRKSSMAFDVINPTGDKTNVQVECLAPEETPRSLVGLLCNDLLVLCKDQSAGKDHNLPVDLWAVLRMQTVAQPASIVQGNALRVVDNKAILYFDAPSTSEALTWCRAINMHIPTSKT
ncbi:hypothetical protein JB92DRAFT_1904343 [Gautieria morchelliformis]|nr:hypothetical protein JB92DRAFT_1904343 [Gautieria morchelliformis]